MELAKIYEELSNRLRQWWLKRWVPEEYCENILEHWLNVKKACEALIKWKIINIDNPKNFIIMWENHDLLEYDMPDFTPHDLIKEEEKLEIEYKVLKQIKIILWKKHVKITSRANYLKVRIVYHTKVLLFANLSVWVDFDNSIEVGTKW